MDTISTGQCTGVSVYEAFVWVLMVDLKEQRRTFPRIWVLATQDAARCNVPLRVSWGVVQCSDCWKELIGVCVCVLLLSYFIVFYVLVCVCVCVCVCMYLPYVVKHEYQEGFLHCKHQIPFVTGDRWARLLGLCRSLPDGACLESSACWVMQTADMSTFRV